MLILRFKIKHSTLYEFSTPVFLEPHQLRFCPRGDITQRVLHSRLTVTPKPSGRSEDVDVEGNSVTQVWFNKMHQHLSLISEVDVLTTRYNPFDFLLTNENSRFPICYSTSEKNALTAALDTSAIEPEINQLAQRFVRESRGEILKFLMGMNQHLYDSIEIVRREEGAPMPALQLLRSKVGACRDVSMVLIAVCRAVGLAARFVSGYQQGDVEQDRRDLHAWTEVYIPRVGWRGFDPTLGLVVADSHVAVATAVDPANTMSVIGSFRKSGAVAMMRADIAVSVEDAMHPS